MPRLAVMALCRRYGINDVTQRIITAAIHQDVSDATESVPKAELGPGTEREP